MSHVIWAIFRYLLLAATCYRVQRIITTDSWPPSEWLRNSVRNRFGYNSSWSDFIECPWCIGTWITVAIFIFNYFIPIPTIIIAAIAASAIVGKLGQADD